ncbi:MAG: polysaccharide biosynthesis tyrosine autokinase [Halieaceae bacterium]
METGPQHYDGNMQEDEIDLRHYWRVIYQQRWNIVALAVAVSIVAALTVLAMRPVYRSTLTLMIESQEAKVLSIEEVYGLGGASKEYFLTQFEILKSRELAEQVVRKLDIGHHQDFDPEQQEPLLGFHWRDYSPFELELEEPTEDEIIAGVVDAFIDSLAVAPVRNTQLVRISFESYDKQLAANVVNELASVYIDSHLDAKLEATQKAATWLSGRLEGLKENLDASEVRLQEYREQEELVDVAGVKTLAARELDEVTTALVEARGRRTEAESIYTQVQALENQSPEALASLPAVLRHSLIQKLKEEEAEAERDVAELSKRYGPLHPKMIAAQSKLQAASENMQRQVVRVVAGVENDYKVASSSEKALERQLAVAKAQVQEINRKEFKLRELQRDVQTNRQLYDMFFTRIRETDETGGMEAAHARVVDAGVVGREPVKPRKALSVMLAFMASLVLGVMLAFLKDALDNSLKSPADVEERLHVPMLGALPKIPKVDKDAGPLTLLLDDKQSSFAESIRTIRTGLILSGLERAHKITVVTSSVPGEGKSTVSINLAAALGQMEKTLIIDADMRRPTMAKTCKLPPNTPGLSNFIAGTAELKDCVHRYEAAGVDILAAGVIPSNPLELISSKRFVQAIDYLGEKYDRILIDSAPTQAVSDAFVLASYADAVIYVVKADATPYTLARHGIERLKNSNAPVAGVILNQFDPSKAPKLGGDYYYYGGYYDYYGYSSGDQKGGDGNVRSINGGKDDKPRVA